MPSVCRHFHLSSIIVGNIAVILTAKGGNILAQPKYTLRVSEILLAKARYVAEWNGRSLNREIELLLKSFVQTFEKQHGTIDKDALAKFFAGNES